MKENQSHRVSSLKKVPKYDIGDKVYAIAIYHNSENVDELDNYARIYIVRIIYIHIEKESISYGVKDEGTDNEWGDDIPEDQVSHDKDELFNYLFKVWKVNNLNTF